MTATDEGCAGHPGLPAEFRALALTALDRLGPLLDRVRSEPAGVQATQPCAVCPVCAVISALRGERSELAARLADQAAGLVTVLRVALEDGHGGPDGGGATDATAPLPTRAVQRIPVTRPGSDA